MQYRNALAAAFACGVAFTGLGVRPAGAAIVAQLALVPEKSTYGVNEPILIDAYLRNITDTNTAAPAKVVGIDLDFGGTSNTTTPLKFAATTAAPKAFLAIPAFAAILLPNGSGSAVDGGSLVDGYSTLFSDLSFASPLGTTNGFTANGNDVFIGTIYASANATGTYVVSARHANTLIQSDDANFDAFTLNYVDASVTVAVPEPAAGTVCLACVGVIVGRRSRTGSRSSIV